jgi:hypothetical protein
MGIVQNSCANPPIRKNTPVIGFLPIVLENNSICKIPAIAVAAAAA